MKRITIARLVTSLGFYFVLAPTTVAGETTDQQVDTPKSRAFRLDYGATLNELPSGARDSRFGNCTDFHSLFISWARAKGLPARFEIGFPLPAERNGTKFEIARNTSPFQA